jgi:hypothetical protein
MGTAVIDECRDSAAPLLMATTLLSTSSKFIREQADEPAWRRI